jgi:hypothetical protein
VVIAVSVQVIRLHFVLTIDIAADDTSGEESDGF